ncbi:MAG TPA: hydroxymethylbilane synthase, partial [Thermoanaerobaculia bacterium]|nr:hydroxymethylbilane synthase [Thermoanaerobaculia bacterium]
GCRAPVGTMATVEKGALKLRARVLSLDGRESFEGEAEGPSERAEGVGRDVATSLERQGAARLVAAAHEVA